MVFGESPGVDLSADQSLAVASLVRVRAMVIDAGRSGRFAAVFQMPQVESPQTAVTLAIVAEAKGKK